MRVFRERFQAKKHDFTHKSMNNRVEYSLPKIKMLQLCFIKQQCCIFAKNIKHKRWILN